MQNHVRTSGPFRRSFVGINVDFFRNMLLVFVPRLLRPAATIGALRELSTVLPAGIRGLILDVDQTVIPYDRDVVHPTVVEEFRELRRTYACCLLSNVSDDPARIARLKRIAFQLGTEAVIPDRLKPDPEAFRCALRVLRLREHEVAVVGDRLLTDIMGANHARMVAVHIRPIDPSADPFWTVRLSRLAERGLGRLYGFMDGKNNR